MSALSLCCVTRHASVIRAIIFINHLLGPGAIQLRASRGESPWYTVGGCQHRHHMFGYPEPLAAEPAAHAMAYMNSPMMSV